MHTHPGDPFGDRRKALEDSFFMERDQQLLNECGSSSRRWRTRKHLAHVSGILDEQVLLNLVKAGVRAETLAAVTLIPLVEVAWSDGAVTADERTAILKAAAESGITEGTAAYEMLGQMALWSARMCG